MAEVVAFDSKRSAEWDAYLESHSEGTIFHLTKWKRAVEILLGIGRCIYGRWG